MSRDFLLYYTTKIIFCQIKSRPGRFPAPANSKRNGVGYVPNKNEIAGWKKLEKGKMKLRPHIRDNLIILCKQKKKSLPHRRLFLFNSGAKAPSGGLGRGVEVVLLLVLAQYNHTHRSQHLQ